MDKFMVRFSAIIMNLYILLSTCLAYWGISISCIDFILTDTLLFGVLLTILCHKQGRYHCVWIRALCYNLIFIPIINFLDSVFVLFYYAETLIYVIASLTMVNIAVTILLAISHFRYVRASINKRRSERYKFDK